MLSCFRKANFVDIQTYGGHNSLEVGVKMLTAWCKAQQFCLLWDHFYVVFFCILDGKIEDAEETVNVITHKANIICLANAATVDITNFQSKIRLLSDLELLVIGQFVESVRVDASLLNIKFISHWSHKDFVPFNVCVPVLHSVVKIEQSLSSTPSKKGILDAKFYQYFVKSTLSI